MDTTPVNLDSALSGPVGSSYGSWLYLSSHWCSLCLKSLAMNCREHWLPPWAASVGLLAPQHRKPCHNCYPVNFFFPQAHVEIFEFTPLNERLGMIIRLLSAWLSFSAFFTLLGLCRVSIVLPFAQWFCSWDPKGKEPLCLQLSLYLTWRFFFPLWDFSLERVGQEILFFCCFPSLCLPSSSQKPLAKEGIGFHTSCCLIWTSVM